MRSDTAPPDTFFHSSPISWRTRYQDDPSGASVAILTTVGAGAAMPGAGAADAPSSRTAAARLINEPFIHPPFQPACAALGHEIADPMFRRPGARVEGERPVEEVEELLPVLGPDRHRLGEGDQRGDLLPPGQRHRPLEVPPGLFRRPPPPPRGGGQGGGGDTLRSGPRRRFGRVRRQRIGETVPSHREPAHSVILRPEQEPAGGRPPPPAEPGGPRPPR